jgi:putative colanic acid biosynthesis glycosyltransferase
MTISLDIVVLCKNNQVEVDRTLCSIPLPSASLLLSLIIVDGSEDPLSFSEITRLSLSPERFQLISSRQCGAFGIYPSMNLALHRLGSEWCIFMNSGDEFHPSFRWSYFCDVVECSLLWDCVFGRCEVLAPSGFSWLMPSLRISSIERWCRYFEPSHQAMFVRSSVARSYSFPESSRFGADSYWKRKVINGHPSFYLRQPVCRFYLGGLSSTYSWRNLVVKLREPSRRGFEKVLEVLKYLLFVCGLMSPRLQWLKSEIVALFF